MIVGSIGYDPLMVSKIISEEEKLEDDYLISNINYTVAVLYTGIREDLQTAYNYFQGKRDEADFEFLKDNYGVGNALDIPFTAFIKTRINYLVGSFLERPFNYKITCTDSNSLDTMEEEKKNEILKQIIDELNQANKELVEKIQEAKDSEYSKKDFESKVNEIYEFIDTKWKSSFEIAAQHLLEYYKNGNLIIKLKRLLEQLIISGSCHYRITIKEVGVEPEIEIIDSREIYYHRNTNEFFMNQCDRVLRVTHMTRQEILNKYGHYLSDEDVEKISAGYRITSMTRLDVTGNMDSRDHYEQSYPYDNYLPYNILRVFEAEWIAITEIEIDNPEYIDNLYQVTGSEIPKKIKRYRKDLYRGVRIGYDIYCNMGKVKHVPRSVDKPYECTLSYNGVSLDDYGKPYSLLMATKDIQDRYDIVSFLRDNIIANSGVKSDRIVLEHIPEIYGTTPEERILKHVAYKKTGVDVISLSQDGVEVGFNNYGQSSNLNLDVQTIQGYNLVLEMYEDLASKFLGVPKEMLGVIQERQAVGNVQMSSIKSTVVTLPLYFTHIQCVRQLLTDLLNYSKVAFEHGKKGSYVLGSRQKIFTIPENALMADYNILVTEGINEMQTMSEIKALAMEFVKGQMIPAKTALELVMNQSLTDVKESTIAALDKMEQDKTKQLQQQLEEATKQNEDMQKKIQMFDEAKTKQIEANIQLDKDKFEFDKGVREREMKLEEDRLKNEKEIANKQINAEIMQMANDTKQDDEPKNISL
jgi:hypothetical protein